MFSSLLLAAIIWFSAIAKAAHDFWACMVVFSAISALSAFELIRRSRTGHPVLFPLWRSWTATLAAVWFSVFHSWDVSSTLWDAWGWTFAALLFYLVANIIQSDETEQTFLRVAGSVVVPLTAFAVYQQLTGEPQGYAFFSFGPVHFQYGHWEIHSTLINAVVFSGFLAAWLIYWWKERGEPWIWLPRFAVLIGILLSRSWWVWVAIGAGVTVLSAASLTGVQTRRAWIRGLGALFLLMLIAVGFKTLSVQHESAHKGSYQISRRVDYWKAAVHMVQDHPWTGVGWSGFGTAFQFYKPGPGEGSRFTHSFPLQIAAETGIPGILAFGVWLIVFLRHRPWRKSRAFSAVIILLSMSAVTIIMNYLLMQFMLVVWMALALRGTSIPIPSVRIPERWAWIGVAAIITMSSFWVKLFQAERLYAGGAITQARVLNPSIGVQRGAVLR